MAEAMMYLKLHDGENGTVIAMCDESLIGSVLEAGDVVIDIKSYAEFYMGALMDRAGALKAIFNVGSIQSANIIGKESVAVALEAGLVNAQNVKKVGNVPYAHAYTVKEPR